jgi:hypothetical protein
MCFYSIKAKLGSSVNIVTRYRILLPYDRCLAPSGEGFPFRNSNTVSNTLFIADVYCLVAKIRKHWSCIPQDVVSCSVRSLQDFSLFMALTLSVTLLAALALVSGCVGNRKSSKEYDILLLEQQGADWGGVMLRNCWKLAMNQHTKVSGKLHDNILQQTRLRIWWDHSSWSVVAYESS